MNDPVSWESAGEALLERDLERENRGGIPHYRPGQHRAEFVERTEDGEVYNVGYVNAFGHAVLVVVLRTDRGWHPLAARAAGQSRIFNAQGWPTGTPLPQSVIAELERVREER